MCHTSVVGDSARVRRSQADRSNATKTALLDATVASLIEDGFTRTTTTAVAQRAGVSLGALVHHYPSKADLLTAAVSHLLERRLSEFRKIMANVDPGADLLDASIDALWSMFSGPTFTAWVELWVGARTDPELALAVTRVDREFVEASSELFAEMFPAAGEFDNEMFRRVGLHTAFVLMGGLALSSMIEEYEPHPAPAVTDAFKAMAHALLAAEASSRRMS
jgi:AcrR family transcriptional regulator